MSNFCLFLLRARWFQIFQRLAGTHKHPGNMLPKTLGLRFKTHLLNKSTDRHGLKHQSLTRIC